MPKAVDRNEVSRHQTSASMAPASTPAALMRQFLEVHESQKTKRVIVDSDIHPLP